MAGTAQPATAAAEFTFPEEWQEIREGVRDPQPAYFGSLEVRQPAGPPSGEYLFAGIICCEDDNRHEVDKDFPPLHYTRPVYAVDFAHRFRIRVATAKEWDRARRVSEAARLLVPRRDPLPLEAREFVEYRGNRFKKSGANWGQATLSPLGTWLAVFSYSGSRSQPLIPFLGGGGIRSGSAFWDIYNARTGERVASWEARDVRGPDSLHSPTTWIDEHRFLVPRTADKKSYLLFSLPSVPLERNPLRITFPSWLGGGGLPMRSSTSSTTDKFAPSREYEVRLLVDDGALSHRELLFRLKDERMESGSIAAVSLDGSNRVRSAAMTEWQRAEALSGEADESTLEEKVQLVGGRARSLYRPFEKRGANWGEPRALDASPWLATFSYASVDATKAPDAPGGSSTRERGTVYVDVYDSHPGIRMLAGESPYSGWASVMFRRARWFDKTYLVIPLDDSYASCWLWILPEVDRVR
jgi:hypothetical protein